MNIKSGKEIVDLHNEYRAKISELEEVLGKLDNYGYTKGMLQVQLTNLQEEILILESTRFQALEPITIVNSALGGHIFHE